MPDRRTGVPQHAPTLPALPGVLRPVGPVPDPCDPSRALARGSRKVAAIEALEVDR